MPYSEPHDERSWASWALVQRKPTRPRTLLPSTMKMFCPLAVRGFMASGAGRPERESMLRLTHAGGSTAGGIAHAVKVQMAKASIQRMPGIAIARSDGSGRRPKCRPADLE
eukprot:scaffold25288_cov112-Isochrysis_galbana.AAC.5